MSDFRAASRYAKSLLQLSDEQGILEKVNQDMILIDETCDANKELALVLKSPIIDHYKKSQILDKIFGKKVNPITKSFYELIGRKGREKMFHSITKEFRKQYLQLKGIEKVSVTTTFQLDDGLREQVKAIAVDISKMKPQLEESINKDIVGGFILNIGSRRIDASIKTKLRKLKKELTK
jgi:F-type H+-transporting ATPase subunit delta